VVRLDRNQRQSRGCWEGMRRAQVEMHSQGKDIVEDCMGERKGKLHREQEAAIEVIGGQVYPPKIKWVQGETQMQ